MSHTLGMFSACNSLKYVAVTDYVSTLVLYISAKTKKSLKGVTKTEDDNK